jgi:hypothetical protein
VYQDLLARWHETTFTIDDQQQLSTRFVGPLGRFAKDTLPRNVLDQAQIVHDSE